MLNVCVITSFCYLAVEHYFAVLVRYTLVSLYAKHKYIHIDEPYIVRINDTLDVESICMGIHVF